MNLPAQGEFKIHRRCLRSQRLSPRRQSRGTVEDLGQTLPGGVGRAQRQRIQRKEPARAYFHVGHFGPVILPPVVADVEGHVVAPGQPRIDIDPEQVGGPGERDPRLFAEFSLHGVGGTLAGVHATAREMPAGGIRVLQQKDMPLVVENRGADPQRNPVGNPSEPKVKAKWKAKIQVFSAP